MTKWTMTRDAAQRIVDAGERKKHSMTQEVRSYPYEREEQVSLMTVSSDWQKVNGVYSAQAYIKGFSANQNSGSYTVYAPTTTGNNPPPIQKGSQVHVANVSGRLECLGGAGSALKIGIAEITWNWAELPYAKGSYIANAIIYDMDFNLIEEKATINARTGYGYGAERKERRLCFFDGARWNLLQIEPVPEEKIEDMIFKFFVERFSTREITYVPEIEVVNGSINFDYKTITVWVYRA